MQVLFNSRNWHAVRGVPEGCRYTEGCFILYMGPEHPLLFWA
jgi:hypothetical protein